MKQRRRRGMVFLLCLLCLLWQVGCNKTEDVLNTSIAQMQMNQNKHAEQLHEYDSRYTVCYRNTDNTYSMYIFSSPILYKVDQGYQVIDNAIIPSEKEGFFYENRANEVKAYFPHKLTNYFRIEKGDDFIQFKPYGEFDGFTTASQQVYTNKYGDKVNAVMYTRKDIIKIYNIRR